MKRTKISSLLALVALLAIFIPTAAYADMVHVELSGAATLTAGQAGQVSVYLSPVTKKEGEGGNGCNATGNTPAYAELQVPAGFLVSPSPLRLVGCGPEAAQSVTVTPPANATGTHTFTVAVWGGKEGSVYTGGALQVNVTAAAPADTTGPVITVSTGAYIPGTWANQDVTVTFTCTDDESGVASCPAAITYSAEGDYLSAAAIATDNAGNSTAAEQVRIMIDKTAPAFSGVANQTAVATGKDGAVVLYEQPAASDNLSGVKASVCTLPEGNQYGLGTTTVTCTATDEAGNSATASYTVSVTVAIGGLQLPASKDSVKQGSNLPVRFTTSGLSAGIADLSARLYVDGQAGVSKSTSGNLFKYDAAAGQYVYNISTDRLSVGAHTITVDLGDGVVHSAQFTVKR